MTSMAEYGEQEGWTPQPWMLEQISTALSDSLVGQGDVRLVTGPAGAVFNVPLGGRVTDNHSEDDVTCDKCDKVFPEGLWGFGIALASPIPGISVIVTGGFCDTCADEEGIERKERI